MKRTLDLRKAARGAALTCTVIMTLTMGAQTALPVADVADEETVVKGNNLFALEIYAQLKNEEGNLFFSPYSVSTALAMTYAGARGSTASQMADVLHLTLPQDALHPALSRLMHVVSTAPTESAYQLNIANALWGQQGHSFLAEYLGLVEQSYRGGFYEVDFENETEGARQTINDWVEERTQNKIQEIIAPSDLNPLTRLVLTNAIYFKGYWMSQFREEHTKDKPFTLITGAVIAVPTMYQYSEFDYAEDDTVRVVEMPYRGDRLSMVILLPREADGLQQLEERLTAENVTNWISALRREDVTMWIPKFKVLSRYDLGKTLARMGMPDAFSLPPADFSGITGAKDFFIGSVIHKAFVEVDEKGTEAAAATAVAAEAGGIPVVKTFKADHPFIFLIRDRLTGCLLFTGRVMDPRP